MSRLLRFEVAEAGASGALPPVDVGDDVIVIGSSASARIRLPARAAEVEHVRIENGAGGELGESARWRAHDGTTGEIGDGVELEVGTYRVRIAPAPEGAAPATPQRTESLARELVRQLLGDAGAPHLVVERGPVVGAKRALAPAVSSLVIGRGDEATWVIFDGDLSRVHAEIRRTWDGVRIVDRGSKNGTRVGGQPVGEGGAPLRDGAEIAIGNVLMRYRDPSEAELPAPGASSSMAAAARLPVPVAATTSAPPPVVLPSAPAPVPARRDSQVVFYAALVLAALAAAAVVYLLAA